MKIILLFTALTLSILSCHKKSQPPKVQTPAKSIIVPFTIANGYFAKDNLLNPNLKPKITTQQEFNQFFGAAATANIKPTKIDFSKEFVIAVIAEKTKSAAQLKPESLTQINDALFFNYLYQKGAPQSFVLQPVLIIIVNKRFDGNVIINRIDEN